MAISIGKISDVYRMELLGKHEKCVCATIYAISMAIQCMG